MLTYTLDQFADIAANINKSALSSEVLSIYDKLLKQLNINTYADNEQEKERKPNRRPRNNKPELLSSGKVVEFKQKEVIEKTDYEKIMINIRGTFNKLSPKNYDTQRDLLMTHLEEIDRTK